jgi:methylated-DNA-protein-cysteine methyltransferase-like protein
MPGVDQWTRAVYAVVRAIPRGRVASYGLVALLAGRARAARAVGNVMLECDDPSVPCHRVIHADGSLAPTFRDQRARLRREGVAFRGARVDLRRALWAARLPVSTVARRRGRVFSSSADAPSSRRTMR